MARSTVTSSMSQNKRMVFKLIQKFRWPKGQRYPVLPSRDDIVVIVEQVLDSELPDSYDRVLFKEKCDNVFELMLDYASNGRR